jgi:hypothetical protein
MHIVVIPDCQVKDGVDLSYLTWIGKWIAEKQPDVIVNIGDFADLPSLSSYDVGKKSFEGRRYLKDVEAVHRGMEILLSPINEYNDRQRKNSKKIYKPKKILTLGNHCNRINRVLENDPKLEGVISVDDLKYKEYGWEVYPFLDVVVVSGIAFSHYFVTGVAGRPAASATSQLNKLHQSCIAGHQQGLQIATGYRADGVRLTSVIAGSSYIHDEDYMGPQSNKNHWRGILDLRDVKPTGEFDLIPISTEYLKRKYS